MPVPTPYNISDSRGDILSVLLLQRYIYQFIIVYLLATISRLKDDRGTIYKKRTSM